MGCKWEFQDRTHWEKEIITLSKHLVAFYFVLFFFVLVHSKHCYFVYLEYGISDCSPNLYYGLTLNEQYISHINNQNKLRLINQKLCNRMTLGPLYKCILLTSSKTEYHIWLMWWEQHHTQDNIPPANRTTNELLFMRDRTPQAGEAWSYFYPWWWNISYSS